MTYLYPDGDRGCSGRYVRSLPINSSHLKNVHINGLIVQCLRCANGSIRLKIEEAMISGQELVLDTFLRVLVNSLGRK